MKILVLGNGFDIDHNLPTSYMDFLNFCNYVLDMDNPESPYRAKLSDFQLEYIKILEQHNEIRETFLMFLKNNRFLLYFNNRINKQGNDWIDFEREIKGVVNEFKSIELELKESNQYHYCTDDDHKIYQVIKDLNYTFITRNFWDEIVLTEIHDELCIDLNNFAHALEYYVAHFINTTPIKGVSPDIIDFDATKIITFNYSDTYERNYGGIRWDESVDHVHGTAIGDLNKESNIILGITSENMQSSYVEFEKYFQRITKKTGNEYKNWLQSRLGKKENIEVMFFGHSLDSADSDIVKDLILNENSKIKIYYHSEAAHQQIVANLIDIIGKEALLKFVSGKEPKICFQNKENMKILIQLESK